MIFGEGRRQSLLFLLPHQHGTIVLQKIGRSYSRYFGCGGCSFINRARQRSTPRPPLALLLLLFEVIIVNALQQPLAKPVQETTPLALPIAIVPPAAPPPQPKETRVSLNIVAEGAIAAVARPLEQMPTNGRCRSCRLDNVLREIQIPIRNEGRVRGGLVG